MRNQHGFSLVQVMIAIALMGGLAVGLMQIAQTQNKISTTSKQDLGLSSLKLRVNRVLLEEDACLKTFTDNGTAAAVTPETVDINKIYDQYGNIVVEEGKIYDGLLLKSIDTNKISDDESRLVLNFDRQGEGFGGKDKKYEIILSTLLNASGELMNCSVPFAEIDQFCSGPGAIYNEDAKSCTIMGADNISCPEGQAVYNVSLDFTLGLVTYKCRQIFEDMTCGAGEVVKRTNSGTPICMALDVGDVVSLIDTSSKDCTGKNNMYLKVVSGKITIDCSAAACAPVVNCTQGAWMNGACVLSNGCKTGLRNQTRSITTAASCGGTACGASSQVVTDTTCDPSPGDSSNTGAACPL